MRHVVEARYVGGYSVWLRFDNGVEKIVDLEGELHGEVFEPLRDPDAFRGVRLDPEADTIVWDTGADFSPDYLYEIGRPVVTRGENGTPNPG